MVRVKKPIDELGEFIHRSADSFAEAMERLVFATLTQNMMGRQRELDSLAELISQTMTLSDLHGRRRVFLESDALLDRTPQLDIERILISDTNYFAETPIVPQQPFDDAVADLLRRDPRLVQNAAQVADVYSTRHGFALARSTDLQLTARVQKAIADLAAKGVTDVEAGRVIAEMGDFTQAYAETVYRTNVATSYQAGRFAQVADPDVAKFIKAFRYVSTLDSVARENHKAAHGLIAGTDDIIWNTYSSPMGFNCHCGNRLVDVAELKIRKLILPNGQITRLIPPTFGGAFPDPGFGRGRPDRLIYAA